MKDSWHLCADCGDKEYPGADKSKWGAITVMSGTCPECKRKNVTLIPRADYEGRGD